MEKLANLIMIRYYLANELDMSDVDFSEKEVELYGAALEESGSVKELKKALDNYIKENDWTGCLGTEGSGRREREFAIEGCLEYAGMVNLPKNLKKLDEPEEASSDELFESVYRETAPAGLAVIADGKIWDNALSKSEADKLALWLRRKGFNEVRVLSQNAQDVKGIPNWSIDEKANIA